MIVAIPISEGRVSPVMDTAGRLLVVTQRRGREVNRREYVINPLPAAALVGSITELRVNVLLCAAVSESLRRSLEEHGVRVRRHLFGDSEVLLRAFFSGHLRQRAFRMPGCWGWHVGGACRRRPRKPRALKLNAVTTTKEKSA